MSYADAVTLDISPLSPGVYLAKTGMVIKGNVRDPVDGTALYLDWWQSRELAGDNLPRGKHTETHASWYSLSKAARCNHVGFLLVTLYYSFARHHHGGKLGDSSPYYFSQLHMNLQFFKKFFKKKMENINAHSANVFDLFFFRCTT